MTFDSTEVDRDAIVSETTPPFQFKARDGHAVATFVVDSTGRADLHTLSVTSADTALARAIRRFLPTARFRPAMIGECRVRVWARWPFDVVGSQGVSM
ncbi:MAG: hypothetical protein ABJD11_03645 [Gemmatimonadota bacterium]